MEKFKHLDWYFNGFYRLVFNVVFRPRMTCELETGPEFEDVRFDVFQRSLKITQTGKDEVNEGSGS